MFVFLWHVGNGKQETAEKIMNLWTEAKKQRLLCKRWTVTDNSDRKFHCTAYEYAYWTKGKHMCRILEGHMDATTKAQMLTRCEAMENNGLTYTQNGPAMQVTSDPLGSPPHHSLPLS